MIRLTDTGVKLVGGVPTAADDRTGRDRTISWRIMHAHSSSPDPELLNIRFDSLISHDITYVGIIQTAIASGLTEFPVPYVMTNCHNSLCAVGGTINEDDHVFGYSAAVKYGGIYVPANQAVIHQYAREMMSGCGRMILGSDSHTRYGAIGTMGIGEGGPEIAKQLLNSTYDVATPETILVWLTGSPARGVGPHDVAIALCGAVYKNNFVKNKVLEFAGPGVHGLPMDYRIGIDVMTTETACLSSVWVTDDKVEEYLAAHGRPETYRRLEPEDGAYYDGMIEIDLGKVEPMAALPFHPSEAFTLRELIADPGDIFRQAEERARRQFGADTDFCLTDKLTDGKIIVDQGIIAGCSGGMYDNIAEAAAIMKGADIGNGKFSLSVYPPSVPVNLELMKNGVQQALMECGALFKPCFCGPCFGAGDVPANNGLSIRHTTRNFPNREGSRPGDGQTASVMLMDARSIAATARNHGVLTPATDIDYIAPAPHAYSFDSGVYEKRVYFGFGRADAAHELEFGPNITAWPAIPALGEDVMLKLAAVIRDPVTTTDELIPSGETSSYRSNPIKLASFALSRRDPEYVGRAEAVGRASAALRAGEPDEETCLAIKAAGAPETVQLSSAIFANKPGDGSAREQAASCQRVLGGGANFCFDYATKRYRSNCINWGMLPFTVDEPFAGEIGDYVYVPGARAAVMSGARELPAKLVHGDTAADITLYLPALTEEEREILLAGCLMNWYAQRNEVK